MLAALLMWSSQPSFSGFPEEKELHIEGQRLVENGNTVTLHGLTLPGLESSNDGEFNFRSCRVAIEDWHANCIRLPLCQDRWFGKAANQNDNGEAYRMTVDEIVTYTTRSEGYVVLDLSWSDNGDWGKNLGPQEMPDKNSVRFWKEVAHKFRGNGKVMFELFGPETAKNKTPSLTSGSSQSTFSSVSFDELLMAVRSIGAKNVVVLDHAITQPFGQKMQGRGSVRFGTEFAAEQATIVCLTAENIVATGTEPTANWIASNFSPSGASPLVNNWTYGPTAAGKLVKTWLAHLAQPN